MDWQEEATYLRGEVKRMRRSVQKYRRRADKATAAKVPDFRGAIELVHQTRRLNSEAVRAALHPDLVKLSAEVQGAWVAMQVGDDARALGCDLQDDDGRRL